MEEEDDDEFHSDGDESEEGAIDFNELPAGDGGIVLPSEPPPAPPAGGGDSLVVAGDSEADDDEDDADDSPAPLSPPPPMPSPPPPPVASPAAQPKGRVQAPSLEDAMRAVFARAPSSLGKGAVQAAELLAACDADRHVGAVFAKQPADMTPQEARLVSFARSLRNSEGRRPVTLAEFLSFQAPPAPNSPPLSASVRHVDLSASRATTSRYTTDKARSSSASSASSSASSASSSISFLVKNASPRTDASSRGGAPRHSGTPVKTRAAQPSNGTRGNRPTSQPASRRRVSVGGGNEVARGVGGPGPARSSSAGNRPASGRGGGGGRGYVSPLVPQKAKEARLEAKRRALAVIASQQRRAQREAKLPPHLQDDSAALSPYAAAAQTHTSSSPPHATRRSRHTTRSGLYSPSPRDRNSGTDTFLDLLRDKLTQETTTMSRSPSAPASVHTATEVLCLQTFIAQQREVIRDLEERLAAAEDDADRAEHREQKAAKRERKAVEQRVAVENKLLRMSDPATLKKLLKRQGVQVEDEAAAHREKQLSEANALLQKENEELCKRVMETEEALSRTVSDHHEAIKSVEQEVDILRERAAEAARLAAERDAVLKESADLKKRAAHLEETADEEMAAADNLRDTMASLGEKLVDKDGDITALSDELTKAKHQVDHLSGLFALVDKVHPGTSKGVCVVCGAEENLELRKSGWKCRLCIGKKSKH
ncbi:hypothetical protein DIPPA_22731 [Diplonema papillatum]|nr:hypothetical protein DIPPA_22731 [Diplonema papillatum]